MIVRKPSVRGHEGLREIVTECLLTNNLQLFYGIFRSTVLPNRISIPNSKTAGIKKYAANSLWTIELAILNLVFSNPSISV